MTLGETFDIGSDTRTSVNEADYQVPFKFTGKINKVTVSLEEPGGPTKGDSPLKKVEERIDRREDCRRQAEAKQLDVVERVRFIEQCTR